MAACRRSPAADHGIAEALSAIPAGGRTDRGHCRSARSGAAALAGNLAAGPLEFRLASPGDIDAFLSSQESGARALDSIDANSPRAETQERFVEQLSLRTISEDSSPIVRIVNSTIYDALKSGASDIHIESGKSGIVVRYRIDGVLSSVSNVDGREAAEQVLSRIKVMAELDIAERRVPQDGRFKISALGRDIDIRVSIMPSIHGEDASCAFSTSTPSFLPDRP